MTGIARPRYFQDPVHGLIGFDASDPVERVLLKLIHTTAFQRLRRVRQGGFAYLVYHGADYSRFAHSLGVVHVARRMVDTINRQGFFTDEADRLEVLCAALLHDVGHGPFSHAIEGVTGVHHELYTIQLITDPASPLHTVLSEVDPTLPERVAAYFDEEGEAFPPERRALRDVVTSQLDADRQDYLLRDGLATGVKLSAYDFERIQAMFEVHESRDERGVLTRRLAVNYRAREAVEGYLIARFHMYKQVYLHRIVRVAEQMLKLTFQRAAQLAAEGYTFRSPPGPLMRKLLGGAQLATVEFLDLDDADVWMRLKAWRHEEDHTLSRLASGLLDRNLYTTIELREEAGEAELAALAQSAAAIATELGMDPAYTVLPDTVRNVLFKPHKPGALDDKALIIIESDGHLQPIEANSDLLSLFSTGVYTSRRLCLPRQLRDMLAQP